MIAELGHFALILAFAVSIAGSVAPLYGAHRGWSDWMTLATPAATALFALVCLSFAALTWSFVTSDFSVRLVVANSHSLKPMIYKIAGVWGNHEGSLLLWVLMLALFGAMVAAFGRNIPTGLKARALGVQSLIACGFIAFMLFTSNPFERLFPAPFDGADLNPLLQDPGLAFHPPFLYLGYVGLSMAFSFAAAALIEGRVDAAWARWVRPWALAAWAALTVGIGLGSWWAYYELGWGGFWFWDPVENASFMPWLAAIALLHSAIVVEKRSSLKNWTILMAILAFSLSLLGTFIVRSGVLDSVHAFAVDPERGVFILLLLVVAIGGSLALYAWRAPSLKSEGVFAPVSRESGLILNNLLMMSSCGVVFAGTMAPLVREALTGAKISVGAPFFDLAFTPFMVLLAIALPLGAMTPWKRGDAGKVLSKLWWAAAAALGAGALVWGVQTGTSPAAPIAMALAAWVALGVAAEIAERAKVGSAPLAENWRRLARAPRADWGKWVAHFGLGVTIWGVAAITAWTVEDIRVARPGESFALGAYEVTFDGVTRAQGPNYVYERGEFHVYRDGVQVAHVYPEKRIYTETRTPTPTTEAGIDNGFTRDLYLVLGDPQVGTGGVPTGAWAVRAYVKPFANWIWGGAILMALGGCLSLTDRRYRVGAPTRAAQAHAAMAPAE
ncbi:heme lyase CcmF/NrfE family subunit [Rubrimonas cliftonensis]|uniref:Cytochrome c-type biogenesis protein CcmF n=1 Tax=Rubrimonas cliftonensis TaxID=89524 RepID=A0A1H3VXA6_9RHOB|nr:heme lyase CcmF/NrfE family subunit [Rubrimonas cliftonensis]SDZ79453.1 cytochrome c-type biogenesis protein CcmF [Rubrimonas cliftonensis]